MIAVAIGADDCIEVFAREKNIAEHACVDGA